MDMAQIECGKGSIHRRVYDDEWAGDVTQEQKDAYENWRQRAAWLSLMEDQEIRRVIAAWWTKQEAPTAKPAIHGLTTVASERFIAPLDGLPD